MSYILTTLQRMHIAEIKRIAARLRDLGVEYLGTGVNDPEGNPGARYYRDPCRLFNGVPPQRDDFFSHRERRVRNDIQGYYAVLMTERGAGDDDA